MEKPQLTTEELLKYKEVEHAVIVSTKQGITEICEYAAQAGKPVMPLLDAHIRNIFPYLRENSTDTRKNTEPIPALEKFWREVSLIGCREFSNLEMHMLTISRDTPMLLLTSLLHLQPTLGIGPIAYLDAIYACHRKEDFKYNSLRELMDDLSRPKKS